MFFRKTTALRQLLILVLVSVMAVGSLFVSGTVADAKEESQDGATLATATDAKPDGLSYDAKTNAWYLYKNNKKVTTNGWNTVNGNLSVCISSGKVVYKLTDSSVKTKYYKAFGKSWIMQKNCWVNVKGTLYYFVASGNCAKIYNTTTKRLIICNAGKAAYAKSQIATLSDGKYYFFNSIGTIVLKKGWYNGADGALYYVNGSMKMKLVSSGKTKMIYKYNYQKKKWVLQKNCIQTVNKVTYVFNSKGKATIKYYAKAGKCYDITSKGLKLVKKQTRTIGKHTYMFNKKGKQVKKAGSYKTSDGYIAKVNKKGYVKKITLDYTYSRYYIIKLKNGKTKKVYGHFDLKSAAIIRKQVNAYRKEKGVAALKKKSKLADVAKVRAYEISYTYGHTRPNGKLCIYSMPDLYGENIACGYKTASDVMKAWKKSPGHNENMLRSNYKYLETAVFIAEKKDKVGFQIYYVQAYGR